MQSVDGVGFSFFRSVKFVPAALYMCELFVFMEFASLQ